VTANAFTFNTQEMVGKVGSGAAAAQTYRVYVGEVTVAGNVVSAIVWYALKGRYKSAFTQNLPATTTVVSFNHNIGTNLVEVPKLTIECTTIDNGYAVGDQIVNPTTWLNTDGAMVFNHTLTSRNAAQFATDGTNAFRTMPKTGGATVGLTQNSWKYALAVKRDW
jgi:LytS/YehU family sensor histidine kinase